MAKGRKKRAASAGAEKVVCRNRRATHDYAIDERLEAGMVLQGSEVKSLRGGKASLAGAFARFINGELWLENCTIPEYEFANLNNHAPTRRRKLLLNMSELNKLFIRVEERGFTLVPMAIYFMNGRAKLELGVGKGKRAYDKRKDIKERDSNREMQRAMRRGD